MWLTSVRGFALALPTRLCETDKVQHMVWSFALLVSFQFALGLTMAMVLVFAVGLAKEFWDARYGSGFCLFDMAANMIGIAAGVFLCLAFILFRVWP